MSFKQTKEGRVFFSGGNKTANDGRKKAPMSGQKSSRASKARQGVAAQKAADTSQRNLSSVQMIALLKSLNDKLQNSQIERKQMRNELDRYRIMVEDIQASHIDGPKRNNDLAARAEKNAQEALKELQEARSLILEIEGKAERADQGLSTLQTQMLETRKHQKTIADRQEDFEGNLEKTQQDYTQLMRQVDKVNEDRARFMRKIEHIEHVVLQTQDSINAKSFDSLSDHGSRGQAFSETIDDRPAIGSAASADARSYERDDDFMRVHPNVARSTQTWGEFISENRLIVVGSAIALLLVAAITIGIGVNGQDTPRNQYAANETAGVTPSELGLRNYDAALTVNARGTRGNNNAQINLNNDEEVLRLLENNPDALARKLNDLEPSLSNPERARSRDTLIEQRTAAQPVLRESAVAPKNPAITAEFARDNNLPPQIAEIQTQAITGNAAAQHDLAAIYTAGHGGVEQNFQRAAYWFGKAADQGIANAAYNLGVLYHQGLGTERDVDTAIAWYTKAAAMGHPEAQYNLGIAYIEGVGVDYSPVKAVDYFTAAADQDVIEAAYNLGLIYENGLLGEAKPDEALMWYKAAADRGSPEAREALEQLAATLNVNLDDVNRLADSMKAVKKTEKSVISADFTEADSILSQTESVTAQVQEYLVQSGFYPGPADGTANAMTRDAIRAYQSSHNLMVNGIADQDLLAYMLEHSVAEEYGSRE